ncbi:MAG: MMPL family transporter [Thiohalomonadaceae bacterium]
MIMRAVLWLMIMLAAMIFSLSQVRISSDMAVFLPHTEEAAQASLLTVLREGPASRLVIVALSGLDDSRHLAEASRAMADRLRDNELFTRISNGPGSLSSKEQDYWFTYRYLLTELDVDDFTYQHLQADMHKRLEELTAPMPPLDKARMPADPQAVFRQVLAAWQNDNSPTLHHGVWFDHAKRHALLLLETQAGGLELDAQDEVRQAIMAAADSGLKLQMTGVGMLAAASREIIRSEAQWLSGLATLIIFLVLYLAYRKLRLLLLGGLPLLAALAIATSVTALLFGSVHGITLAFGLSLLGVAVDYPIHLFSHLQQNSSPQQTLQRIWPTIRLGAASTAVGYLAIATSPFQGLAQLAVFMVSGLLASVLTVRWLLPPLLASGQSLTHSYAARGAGRSVWFLLLPVVLALAYLAWTPRPLLQTELSALSPISADAREQDAYLRSLIGVPDVSRLLLIKADTVEEVLQASEALSPLLVQLRSKGIISGYRLPSTYLPSVARQLKRQAALPDKSTLSENLALASQDLPFRAGLFTPFLDAVAASKMLAPLTPEAVKDTLAGQMLDSVLHSTGGQWLGLVPLHDVQNEAILAAWTEQTGLPCSI